MSLCADQEEPEPKAQININPHTNRHTHIHSHSDTHTQMHTHPHTQTHTLTHPPSVQMRSYRRVITTININARVTFFHLGSLVRAGNLVGCPNLGVDILNLVYWRIFYYTLFWLKTKHSAKSLRVRGKFLCSTSN